MKWVFRGFLVILILFFSFVLWRDFYKPPMTGNWVCLVFLEMCLQLLYNEYKEK